MNGGVRSQILYYQVSIRFFHLLHIYIKLLHFSLSHLLTPIQQFTLDHQRDADRGHSIIRYKKRRRELISWLWPSWVWTMLHLSAYNSLDKCHPRFQASFTSFSILSLTVFFHFPVHPNPPPHPRHCPCISIMSSCYKMEKKVTYQPAVQGSRFILLSADHWVPTTGSIYAQW